MKKSCKPSKSLVLVYGSNVAPVRDLLWRLTKSCELTFLAKMFPDDVELETANVIVLLDATSEMARSLPARHRSRAVLTATDPILLSMAVGLGYVGAVKSSDQLPALIQTVLERVESSRSR